MIGLDEGVDGLDEGVDALDLTDLGEPAGLLDVWAARELGREAYGSAVAGRLISARRGFMAGRMGADERDDSGAPVGTVRVEDLGAWSKAG